MRAGRGAFRPVLRSAIGVALALTSSAAALAAEPLLPSDAQPGDRFGSSAAAAGNIVVVGAIGSDEAGPFTGSAYVFEERAAGERSETRLVGSDSAARDFLGAAVMAAEGLVAAGAPFADVDGDQDAGAVYVFEPDGAGWSETAKLVASDTSPFATFGAALSGTSDRIVVGAPGMDGIGAAYVFERDAEGEWSEVARLSPTGGAQGDRFGQSTAVVGERLEVGAAQVAGPGYATVFDPDPEAGWVEAATLSAEGGQPDDRFGESVAVDGDRVIVGATGADGATSDTGSAYLFERGAGGWPQAAKLFRAAGAAGDAFGASLGITDGVVRVASPDASDGAGVVSTFVAATTGWQELGPAVVIYEEEAANQP